MEQTKARSLAKLKACGSRPEVGICLVGRKARIVQWLSIVMG
jgi:hypothetical protein